MFKGVVKRWFDDRAFGFIVPDAGGADVFVHVNAVTGRMHLSVGERVAYNVEIDPRNGRSRAVDVAPL